MPGPLPPAAGDEGLGGLVVMGGSMGVYEADAHPFLKSEMLLISDALRASCPVLGSASGASCSRPRRARESTPARRRKSGGFPCASSIATPGSTQMVSEWASAPGLGERWRLTSAQLERTAAAATA
ncbi:MAG TPA: hypothetical protein VMG58_12615, partial [Candidatus Sulfotelmatobacter sp.]|nr:hypothetical protein [Candidatus Sulfotelmatobacter sp.]